MGLCCPPLPLHKYGIREFGGVGNYLKCSTGRRRFRSREGEQSFRVINYCRDIPSVTKSTLELRTTNPHIAASPGGFEWSAELGAGRQIWVQDQRRTTLLLGTVMSPPIAPSNGNTASGDGLMAVKQQKNFQVTNSVENFDETSELVGLISEPLSNGERLVGSSPSKTVNFVSREEASEKAAEAPSQAQFSGRGAKKSSPAHEVVSTAMAGRGRTASSRKVAVIGAGAAGLVAARELIREGHEVVIFEQGQQSGGVWQYDPRVEDDPLGIDPHRSRVHSSMYLSLRTNLPREIMGFLDYPFVPREGEGRDGRRFPNHTEVARYLEDFEEHYNLTRLVKFEIRVDYVGQQDTKWIVKFHKTSDFRTVVEPHEKECQDAGPQTEVFDAVVVCSGHFAEPRLVPIPGAESWPGVQMHSHNYRFPHPFQDKVVVVIGSANSAEDITREIATAAKEVHQCARAWKSADSLIEWQGPEHNIWRHPMVTRACNDGTVEFQDGKAAVADIILYCTGYLYSFPFLDTKGYISVDDNRVGPLYQHVFPPAFAPTLSFVGVPWKVVPFQLLELQSTWIATLLSGKSNLPSESEMMSDIRAHYEQLQATMEFPKSYTHMLGRQQFDYLDWLAEQSGHQPVDAWRKEITISVSRNKIANPSTYRDEIEDQYWYEVAMASLAMMKVPSQAVSHSSGKENSSAYS